MNNEEESLYPFSDVSQLIKKRINKLIIREDYFALARNVLIMALIFCIAFTKVFCLTISTGVSMYPAILDGDVIIGYRLSSDYAKNDVVICDINGKQIIGRVVAKGGDSVNITDEGILYVNGTEQTGEIFFPTIPTEQNYPYIVQQDCFYILNDYRTDTNDSRIYGSVNKKSIKSKAVGIIRKRGI